MSLAPFVAYYRVSTSRQGHYGLGMDAQRAMVRSALQSRGDVVAEFSEIGNSTRPDRPTLNDALASCRKLHATLIVARLDRLCRNVAFFAALLESDVQFVAADMPFANRATLHVMAALAEYEHEMMSVRTKEAIRQARARGRKVGNWSLSPEDDMRRHSQMLLAMHRRLDEFSLNVYPTICRLRRMGLRVPRRIAIALDASGVPTKRGGRWTGETVVAMELRARLVMKDVPSNTRQSLWNVVRKLKRQGISSYHSLARALNRMNEFNESGRPWNGGTAARVFAGLL